MQGTVKWFSEKEGYGFIVSEDGTERYFNVRNIQGINLPKIGALVSFVPKERNGKLTAKDIKITAKPLAPQASGDRVSCPHCSKQITPRIITNHGRVERTVCPFCGQTVKNFTRWWHLLFGLIGIFLGGHRR